MLRKPQQTLTLHILGLTFLLSSCSYEHRLVKTEYQLIEVNESNVPVEDKEIAAFIEPYKAQLGAEMNKVIAATDVDMNVEFPDGLLNNFVAEQVYNAAKEWCVKNNSPQPDLAIINHGGLRKNLVKGNITLGDMFEVMPFENEIVVLLLGGSQIEQLLKTFVDNRNLTIWGLKAKVVNNELSDVSINGKPFNVNSNYWIATSDYLANGGDNLTFLKNASKRKGTYIKVRDVLTAYCTNKGKQNQALTPVYPKSIIIQ